MLSNFAKSFISNEMAIELSSIERRLVEPGVVEHRNEIEAAISKFIDAIVTQQSSGRQRDPYSFSESEAEQFINNHFRQASKCIASEKAIWTLDSLRHAFVSFAFNGLHQLYTRQENEVWYPKVVLKDVLTPNDIDTLDDVFTIFRGCDVSEFATRRFGQSWSTSEKIALEFAFKHYESQDWFQKESRVVLRATYRKSDVLFSNQTDFGEFEVAVETDCLDDVVLCGK